MPSTAPHIPVRWIALRDAWKCSPWSSKTLLEFAKRGVLEARLEEGHWCFEPTGFYMAMRKELALEHWRALRDVAISYDVKYDALLELVEDHTLYALYTDTDWYIEPDECARIPELVPQALKPVPSRSRQRLRDPVTTVEPSTQVELPFTTAASPILPLAVCPHEEERREPEWLHFREAVRQSEFTHSELHRAVRQGEVESMRHAQGYLLVCMKSLEDYTPARHWLTLETYASSMTTRARSLLLKRLQSGERPGRLMNGTWYLEP